MESQTSYRGFKDLNCWREGRELRKMISDLCKSLPDNEKFLLTSQMIRASRSITANIAEGYGRFTYTDTRHFFIQARGSVTEVLDHVILAQDEGYVSVEMAARLEEKAEIVFKLINGYIAYLERSQKLKTKNYLSIKLSKCGSTISEATLHRKSRENWLQWFQ